MREVIFQDESGKKHRSVIRDSDHISRAAMGIPIDMPQVTDLDWKEIAVQLHNLLVERRIITTRDISEKQGQLANAVRLVVERKVIDLYRKHNKEYSNGN